MASLGVITLFSPNLCPNSSPILWGPGCDAHSPGSPPPCSVWQDLPYWRNCIYLSTSGFPIALKIVTLSLFSQGTWLEFPSWKLCNTSWFLSLLWLPGISEYWNKCSFIVILLAFPVLGNQVIDVKVICIQKVLKRSYCFGSYYGLRREFKFRTSIPQMVYMVPS